MPLRPGSLTFTLVLGVLIALMPFTNDIYMPAMPVLVASLNTDVPGVQFTLAAFIAGIAIGQIVYGPLSDRYGRRPMLIAGLAVFAASSAACAFSHTVDALAALRFLQALGLAAAPVLGRTVARDLASNEQAARLLARMMVVSGVAPIVAPLLSGLLLAVQGWQAIFLLLSLLGAAMLAVIVWGMPETAPKDRTPVNPLTILRNFGQLLRHPAFLAPLAALCASQAALFAFVTNSSFVIVRGLGYSPAAFGAFFAIVMVGQIVAAQIASRVVVRRGVHGMIAFGAGLGGLSGICIAVLAWMNVTHVAALIAPMTVYMFASGFLNPAATAAAMSPFPKIAGSAASLIGSLQMTVGAITGLVLSLMYDGTARPMATAIGVAALALLLVERLLLRPVRREARHRARHAA